MFNKSIFIKHPIIYFVPMEKNVVLQSQNHGKNGEFAKDGCSEVQTLLVLYHYTKQIN